MPEASIPHLRTQLLEKIFVFGASPSGKLIANKLCLAMSAFILHTVTDEWTEAVSELTSTFQSMERLTVSMTKNIHYSCESFCICMYLICAKTVLILSL